MTSSRGRKMWVSLPYAAPQSLSQNLVTTTTSNLFAMPDVKRPWTACQKTTGESRSPRSRRQACARTSLTPARKSTKTAIAPLTATFRTASQGCTSRLIVAALPRGEHKSIMRPTPERKDWSQLPQELLGRITSNFGKVCGPDRFYMECGSKTFFNLQLVCKDWHTATLKFSGGFAVNFEKKGSAKLAKICEKLPSTSQLQIVSGLDDTFEIFPDLSPISSCWGLSSLYLQHSVDYEGGNNDLDLAILPSNLKDLETWAYTIDMASAPHLRCSGLTRLCLSSKTNSYAQILQLLPHLKDLKELEMSLCEDLAYTDREDEEEEAELDLGPLLRYPQLTSLDVYYGRLPSPPREPRPLTSLQNLFLGGVKVSAQWMQALYDSDLQHLEMTHCSPTGENLEGSAFSTAKLRSLSFYSCPTTFLPVEAPCLQSLKLDRDSSDIQAVAKYTSLTHLRLCDHHSTDLQALQSLPLKDLDVMIRTEAIPTLFTPGSLTGLQKVDLYQLRHAPAAASTEAQQALTESLSETARSIQSLPSLRTLSGWGTILDYLVEGFNGWREEKQRMQGHPPACSCYDCEKTIWKRSH